MCPLKNKSYWLTYLKNPCIGLDALPGLHVLPILSKVMILMPGFSGKPRVKQRGKENFL